MKDAWIEGCIEALRICYDTSTWSSDDFQQEAKRLWELYYESE